MSKNKKNLPVLINNEQVMSSNFTHLSLRTDPMDREEVNQIMNPSDSTEDGDGDVVRFVNIEMEIDGWPTEKDLALRDRLVEKLRKYGEPDTGAGDGMMEVFLQQTSTDSESVDKTIESFFVEEKFPNYALDITDPEDEEDDFDDEDEDYDDNDD